MLTANTFQGLTIFVEKNFVWILFLLALGVFVIYSIVLLYHWVRYGASQATVWLAMIIYFGVAFVIISIALASAIALT